VHFDGLTAHECNGRTDINSIAIA